MLLCLLHVVHHFFLYLHQGFFDVVRTKDPFKGDWNEFELASESAYKNFHFEILLRGVRLRNMMKHWR